MSLSRIGCSGAQFNTVQKASDAIFEELRYQIMELSGSQRDKMGNTAVDYMFRNTKISQSRMQDIITSLKPKQGGNSVIYEQHVSQEADALQKKLLAQNFSRR
jgi:hypothetical protein